MDAHRRDTHRRYRQRRYLEIAAGGLLAITAVTVLVVAMIQGALNERRAGQNPSQAGSGAADTLQQPSLPTLPANPYGQEDFALEDGYMTCLAGETLHGIDVSFWQGDIDWQAVKDSGVEFVMIRLGWRSSKTGELSPDENAYKNLEGATQVGLPVGGYFFSQAKNPEEAAEEAAFTLEIIKDYTLTMPIVYDWEYLGEESRAADMDARTLTDSTKAFCEAIEAAGHEAMIYFNPAFHNQKQMFIEELAQYHFWLAMYDSEMDYPYQVDMWQYSCTGTVPGIQGDVDLNIYFKYE